MAYCFNLPTFIQALTIKHIPNYTRNYEIQNFIRKNSFCIGLAPPAPYSALIYITEIEKRKNPQDINFSHCSSLPFIKNVTQQNVTLQNVIRQFVNDKILLEKCHQWTK